MRDTTATSVSGFFEQQRAEHAAFFFGTDLLENELDRKHFVQEARERRRYEVQERGSSQADNYPVHMRRYRRLSFKC